MASVIATADSYFNLNWTGRSDIHVSIFKECIILGSAEDSSVLLSRLDKGKVGYAIYTYLTTRLEQVEWLISADEFNTLFLVDMYRHLNNQGDTKADSKLQNPITGNVIHRLGLRGDLVGGIRFWVAENNNALGLYTGYSNVGWRFRLERLTLENEEPIRVRAREIIEESQMMIEMVLDSFMAVAEPTKQEMKTVELFTLEMEKA